MSNISVWPLDRTHSDATITDLSGPGKNGYEGVLCIHQHSKIEVSPSDCLVSYPGHLLSGVLPIHRDAVDLYSTAQANWRRIYKLWIVFGEETERRNFPWTRPSIE